MDSDYSDELTTSESKESNDTESILNDASNSSDNDDDKDLSTDCATEPNKSIAYSKELLCLSSDNENSEKCAICLLAIKNQEVGSPDVCDHIFCFECINEWATNINTCPIDRLVFNIIIARKNINSKNIWQVTVKPKNNYPDQLEIIDEEITFCEVCHNSNREDRMLLCDGCNNGYHLECLDPPLSAVPREDWFCPPCAHHVARGPQNDRVIARTRIGERVRETVRRNRELRQVNEEMIRRPKKRRKLTKRKSSKQKKTSYKHKRNKKKKTYKKSTVKRRLSNKLKFTAPAPGQITPRLLKMSTAEKFDAICNIQSQLSIYGGRDDILPFADDYDYNESRQLMCKTKLKENVSNSDDILGSIIQGQKILHMNPDNIIITSNGILKPMKDKTPERKYKAFPATHCLIPAPPLRTSEKTLSKKPNIKKVEFNQNIVSGDVNVSDKFHIKNLYSHSNLLKSKNSASSAQSNLYNTVNIFNGNSSLAQISPNNMADKSIVNDCCIPISEKEINKTQMFLNNEYNFSNQPINLPSDSNLNHCVFSSSNFVSTTQETFNININNNSDDFLINNPTYSFNLNKFKTDDKITFNSRNNNPSNTPELYPSPFKNIYDDKSAFDAPNGKKNENFSIEIETPYISIEPLEDIYEDNFEPFEQLKTNKYLISCQSFYPAKYDGSNDDGLELIKANRNVESSLKQINLPLTNYDKSDLENNIISLPLINENLNFSNNMKNKSSTKSPNAIEIISNLNIVEPICDNSYRIKEILNKETIHTKDLDKMLNSNTNNYLNKEENFTIKNLDSESEFINHDLIDVKTNVNISNLEEDDICVNSLLSISKNESENINFKPLILKSEILSNNVYADTCVKQENCKIKSDIIKDISIKDFKKEISVDDKDFDIDSLLSSTNDIPDIKSIMNENKMDCKILTNYPIKVESFQLKLKKIENISIQNLENKNTINLDLISKNNDIQDDCKKFINSIIIDDSSNDEIFEANDNKEINLFNDDVVILANSEMKAELNTHYKSNYQKEIIVEDQIKKNSEASRNEKRKCIYDLYINLPKKIKSETTLDIMKMGSNLDKCNATSVTKNMNSNYVINNILDKSVSSQINNNFSQNNLSNLSVEAKQASNIIDKQFYKIPDEIFEENIKLLRNSAELLSKNISANLLAPSLELNYDPANVELENESIVIESNKMPINKIIEKNMSYNKNTIKSDNISNGMNDSFISNSFINYTLNKKVEKYNANPLYKSDSLNSINLAKKIQPKPYSKLPKNTSINSEGIKTLANQSTSNQLNEDEFKNKEKVELLSVKNAKNNLNEFVTSISKKRIIKSEDNQLIKMQRKLDTYQVNSHLKKFRKINIGNKVTVTSQNSINQFKNKSDKSNKDNQDINIICVNANHSMDRKLEYNINTNVSSFCQNSKHSNLENSINLNNFPLNKSSIPNENVLINANIDSVLVQNKHITAENRLNHQFEKSLFQSSLSEIKDKCVKNNKKINSLDTNISSLNNQNAIILNKKKINFRSYLNNNKGNNKDSNLNCKSITNTASNDEETGPKLLFEKSLDAFESNSMKTNTNKTCFDAHSNIFKMCNSDNEKGIVMSMTQDKILSNCVIKSSNEKSVYKSYKNKTISCKINKSKSALNTDTQNCTKSNGNHKGHKKFECKRITTGDAVSIAKPLLKPFFKLGKISIEEYKNIMRLAVPMIKEKGVQNGDNYSQLMKDLVSNTIFQRLF